jgi:hypothetical protein
MTHLPPLDPKLPPDAYEGIAAELLRAAPTIGWHAACEGVAETLQLAEATEHPWQVYALAAQIAPVGDRQALRFEALFMLGRIDMKANTLSQEARKRSANAKKGGRPLTVTDQQIAEVHAEWTRSRGHERGWKKEAARRFGISDTAISKRWSGIKSGNKPG